MTPELKYLAWTSVLSALLWIPYILNVLVNNKMSDAVGYSDSPLVMSPWAARMKKAHSNAIENLVVFAVLVLIADAMEISNNATISSAATYFWARLLHVGVYTAGIPWVRTLTFVVAWGATICIAWQILA